MEIGETKVSEKHPVSIIAKTEINYNGSLNRVKKLVDVTVDAGADVFKFQTFKPEEIFTNGLGTAEYAKKIENLETAFAQNSVFFSVETEKNYLKYD